jgi:hypothetical protein
MLTNEEIEALVKTNDTCVVCGDIVPETAWRMGIPNPKYTGDGTVPCYNIVSFCSRECVDGFEALLAE